MVAYLLQTRDHAPTKANNKFQGRYRGGDRVTTVTVQTLGKCFKHCDMLITDG